MTEWSNGQTCLLRAQAGNKTVARSIARSTLAQSALAPLTLARLSLALSALALLIFAQSPLARLTLARRRRAALPDRAGRGGGESVCRPTAPPRAGPRARSNLRSNLRSNAANKRRGQSPRTNAAVKRRGQTCGQTPRSNAAVKRRGQTPRSKVLVKAAKGPGIWPKTRRNAQVDIPISRAVAKSHAVKFDHTGQI